MAVSSGIEVEGVIREVLADGLYRAELVNGHKPLAHLNS
jgi:translation initiation factor IF-1